MRGIRLKILLIAAELLSVLAVSAQTLAVRAYTTANGLPQSSVYCLKQGPEGRLWIGTQGGVCVYDGKEFRSYGGRDGLPDSHVQAVAVAPDGQTVWLGLKYAGLAALMPNGRIHSVRLPGLHVPGRLATLWASQRELWVGSRAQGVWQLSFGAGRTDTLSRHWSSTRGLPTDTVEWLGPGLRGRLWATTPQGVVVFDRRSGQPLPAERAALPPALRQRLYGCYRVSDSVAWVGTANGLLRVSAGPSGWRLRRYAEAQGLPTGQVLRVVQDDAGRVWVSTAAGLFRGVPQASSLRFQSIASRTTFDHDRACDVLMDCEGSLWAANDVGVNQYLTDERFAQFTTADGLPANPVTALALPTPNELWVGTHEDIGRLPLDAGGGVSPARSLVVPARTRRGHYVLSLAPDSRGGVWVGTLGEGARRYDLQTGHWETYDHNVEGLAGQYVASITEDRRGRVWLVTHRRGVTVYDPTDRTFRTFRSGTNGLTSDNFWQVYRDRAGRLWLASDDAGLISVDTDRDTFRRVDGQAGKLTIGSISEDRRGHLWLGPVGQPLLRYEPATGRLHTYGLQLGLQSINPYFVQCDSADRVWVGTHLGIDVFDTKRGSVRSYAPADGFLGGEADENAVLLSPNGQVWMGTVGGLMRYDPRHVPRASAAPLAHLTGLRVNLRDTTLQSGLALPHQLNSLSFDFRGVSLARPGSVRYQYRMRGLAEQWVGPGEGTSATFASLAPGAYVFEVRAANEVGQWSAVPAQFGFTIQPPWWRTWWAYALYLSGFGLIIYGVRGFTKARERDRADRRLEHQALAHLQELDRVKTDFFTNVSHELRTPLTLILGPAENLATEPADATVRQQGGLVLRHARKLLTLINQLLDLSKLEAGALRLLPTSGDAAAAVRQLAASFSSLAQSRGIVLHCDIPTQPVPLVFDSAKLEDILTNLLANALRFTPTGGLVTVSVAETPPSVAAPQGGVAIAVHDTGPGIAPEDQQYLFDRFYQTPEAVATGYGTGTGIGLALVRELTALHGGHVGVTSELGVGSTFTVHLPRVLQPVALPEPAAPAVKVPSGQSAPAEVLGESEKTAAGPEAPVVLIVEDNDEVREFVRATLAPDGYQLLLAADGQAGLDLAQAEVPDLVVSDVMMPGLDGYQLCAQLKTSAATSHIPVVLLTAKSGDDAKLEGLETGADSFLAKPFNPRALRAQVRNLLALRERLQARLAAGARQTDSGAAHETVATPAVGALAAHAAAVAGLPSLDQEFLRRVNESVLAHLSDEAFGVDELGADIGMSRTQVHRKLKALSGQSPGECIRSTRMHRALALLQAQVGTVAEVGYQVGFSSPAAFSTAFSRQFGYPPSAVSRQVSGALEVKQPNA